MYSVGKYVRVFDEERGCSIFEHDKVWLDANGFSDLKSIQDYKDGSYVIHHINGNRADNRLENLQLLTRAEHAKLHASWRESDYAEKISCKLKGIKRSPETRAKMSAYQKANPKRTMLGKHHTEETKKKLRESNKVAWERKTEEEKEAHKKKVSESLKGRPAHNKGVPCPEHQKEFLSSYWKDKYANGYVSPSIGRIFVTNGIENHQIKKDELQSYLDRGFVRGFTRRKKIDKQ